MTFYQSHPVLAPLLSQEPAAQLIRQTARQQWRLIALNLGSSLVEAFSEGATLAVVFLAVELLATPATAPFKSPSNPLLNWAPAIAGWVNTLPRSWLFVGLLVLAVLLQALQSLTRFLSLVSVGYFAARCRALITARIHSQVLSLSFPCASGYKVGDLTDYASQGPEAIRQQIDLSANLLVGLLLSGTYLAVLVGISPWLLLVAVSMAGLISVVQHHVLPRIRAGAKAVAQVNVAISSRITEDFQGLRLLHSSGMLDAADQEVRSRMAELEGQLRRQSRRLAVVGPFSSFLPILAIAVIAVLSLLLLGARSSGVLPSLVTFVLALQRLTQRLSGLSDTVNRLGDNSGRMARLNAILSSEGKKFRRLGGAPFMALEQAIRFDAVSLRYSPELPLALHDVTFTLTKGETLALVGPSGAGKSSISDLLTGLYNPTSGRILVDGTPLDHYNLISWQKRLGVVSQDTFLFNATIAENIAFGISNVTNKQIEDACEVAQAAEFIEYLPQGYETRVGERGYRLSGGQRQRLSLARAILRKPELLILDEATSALDSQNEYLVQKAIESLDGQFTIIVIAHRLSTVTNSDRILVLSQGKVVQQGETKDLFEEDGLLKDLWKKQHTSRS